MKTLTRIASLCVVLTAFLYAAACAGDDRSGVQFSFPPTANGHVIGADDLSGLKEIAVSVQVTFTAPKNVTLFASFYDGNNQFIGMGATSTSVDNETAAVMIPVENNVTDAEVLKIAVTDADFRPLRVSRYFLNHKNETPVLSGAFGGVTDDGTLFR